MRIMLPVLAILFVALATLPAKGAPAMTHAQLVDLVLQQTKPLAFPRGDRLPLYVWTAMDIDANDDAEIERILSELNARGIGVCMSWNNGKKEESLTKALRVAAIQQKLGLPIGVNATSVTYAFFNGDQKTAHVTEAGEKFFDESFAKGVHIGCPFTVQFRYPAMHDQIAYFVDGYKAKNLPMDFVFADWEIDGPMEWNDAWANAKKCAVCRERIKKIDDFAEFQKAYRVIRSEMQKVYADAVKAAYPKVLVGNYAVNPHDGYRYWFDYFEYYTEGTPFKADQRAKYRPWYPEFPLTGYTYAMPVVYTWDNSFSWYDFENTDYRWFYNMLLEASSAGKATPANIPIISFVHWHTIMLAKEPDPNLKQFSAEKYQELLWHMLLRGTDTFFAWYVPDETADEVRLLQQVYADALQYKEFLDKGTPVSFDVPNKPGPVVSGLQLGNRILIRRTDFDDTKDPVKLKVGKKTLQVPRVEGKCQVLTFGR